MPRVRTISTTTLYNGIVRLQFSGKGDRLVIAVAPNTVLVYDLSDDRKPPTILDWQGTARITAIAVSDSLIAAASDECDIRFWKLDGRWVKTIQLRREEFIKIVSLQFCRGVLAAAPYGNTTLIWDDPLTSNLKCVSVGGRDLSFSADGSTLAVLTLGMVHMVRTTGWTIDDVPIRSPAAGRIAMNSDGRSLATGGGLGDGTIRDWNANRQLRETSDVLISSGGGITAISYTPDDRLLLATRESQDPYCGTLYIHNQETNQTTSYIFDEPLIAMDVDPHSRWFVTGDSRGRVVLWALPTR